MRSIIVVLAITSAFAQETKTLAVEGAWEYCWIERTGARMLEGASNVQGIAEVCHANAEGCHTETVEVTVPKSDLNENHATIYTQQATRKALAKTLAKLGSSGWELVTVSSLADGQIFYMKRHIQSTSGSEPKPASN